MATITKTIGTSSRDYSTIGAWASDLDDASIYSDDDDAVGSCYNDSSFGISNVIGDSSYNNLGSILLTVAEGERHDGTAGTGAVIEQNGAGWALDLKAQTTTANWLIAEWFEIDALDGGNSYNSIGISSSITDGVPCIRNMVVHNNDRPHIEDGNKDCRIQNCFFYAGGNLTWTTTGCVGVACNGGAAGGIFNITILMPGTGTHAWQMLTGFTCRNGNADTNLQNIIVMGTRNVATDSYQDFRYVGVGVGSLVRNNMSEDDTAQYPWGPTHGYSYVMNADPDTQFVSTSAGSEDLHLKTGSDAIGAGYDLGTTPPNVNIDIDARDRDSEADTWDIGADQFVGEAATTGPSFAMFVE